MRVLVVEDDEMIGEAVCTALGIGRDEVVAHQWVDNGPGWCAVMLASRERTLRLYLLDAARGRRARAWKKK